MPPTIKYSHPWATVTSKPGRFGVGSIKKLHVVIAAVRLLLDFKCLEDELYAIAFLGWDHPLTVRTPRVVVVPKLGVWKQVLGFDFSLQVTSTLWKENWIFNEQISGLISSSCCAWNKQTNKKTQVSTVVKFNSESWPYGVDLLKNLNVLQTNTFVKI